MNLNRPKTTTKSSRIPWWFTQFGEAEIAAVTQAISTGSISHGKITEAFEEEFASRIDCRYAISTTSGSTALFLALLALGVQAGDEVIVPARTWIATAHAASLLGARVVLVDVEPDLPRLDIEKVKDSISSKTRAILPVHLNGRGVDIEKLREACSPYNISIVEDACQAYRSKRGEFFLGTQGEASCFSLGMTKLLTSGQGGVITTQDQDFANKLRSLRCHGIEGSVHTPQFKQTGGNFRFTDLQASFAKTQLSKIEKREQQLRDLYQDYQKLLSEFSFIKLIPTDLSSGELPLYIEVLVEHREHFIKHLDSYEIETRPFLPCLSTANYFNSTGSYPNSAKFSNHGLYLPSGPDQHPDLMDRIYTALKQFNHPKKSQKYQG